MIRRFDRVTGNIEMILAMSFAGSTVVAGKLLAGRYSVFIIGFMSLFFAFAFMLPLQLFKIKELLSLRVNDLKNMFFQAFFGIVLFRLFTLTGLRFTGALSAGILTSTTPAVMAVSAVVFLKEKLKLKDSFSILLAVLGIVTVNSFITQGGGEELYSMKAFAGNMLILTAVAGEALLTVFRKKSERKISSLTNTTVLVSMSLLIFSLFAGKELSSFDFYLAEGPDVFIFLYYGVFGTAAAYMLWGDGAVRIEAKKVGLISSCMPLSAIILSTAVLKETIEWYHIAGMILIISSLIIGCREGKEAVNV